VGKEQGLSDDILDDDILGALRDVTEREQEEEGRYLAEWKRHDATARSLKRERSELLIRARDAGIPIEEIADAIGSMRFVAEVEQVVDDVGGILGFRTTGSYVDVTEMEMGRVMRRAEKGMARAVEEELRAARARDLMDENVDLTFEEALRLVDREEVDALEERGRRLEAWVAANGNGVTVSEWGAREILRRVEPLRRPNARTVDSVADWLRAPEGVDKVEVAKRVIAFVKAKTG
jgi:hypothetical protein